MQDLKQANSANMLGILVLWGDREKRGKGRAEGVAPALPISQLGCCLLEETGSAYDKQYYAAVDIIILEHH